MGICYLYHPHVNLVFFIHFLKQFLPFIIKPVIKLLKVMASDGLWDVLSSMEVINIIKNTVKEPGMCSKRLATEAVERGSKDNITVIVVFLRPVSTAERIY